jgi:hypothetical protein
LGDGSERRVRGGEGIRRLAQLVRQRGDDQAAKRRSHGRRDERKIEQDHRRLAPGVSSEAPHASKQRTDQ